MRVAKPPPQTILSSIDSIVPLQPSLCTSLPNPAFYLVCKGQNAGEIAALARTTGAPNSLFESVGADEEFHILSVPASGAVSGTCSVTSLTAEHYPDLISPGQPIETVGVSTILITTTGRESIRVVRRSIFSPNVSSRATTS